MARRRFTQKQKENLVRKFEDSESSATDFCREHRLSCQSLRRWRGGSKGSEGAAEPTSFVELEVEPGKLERPCCRTGPAVELVLGGGMVLRIFAPQPERRP
jgi:transposase-like protein